MTITSPRTVEQATGLLERHALVRAAIAAHEAQRAENLASTNAAADVVVAPLIEELQSIERALQPWWKRAAAKLTGGKRKSIELGGSVIGTRTGSASLAFPGGDAAALAAVLASPLKTRLTVKRDPVLDKKGIAALLRAGGAMAAKVGALGFRIEPGVETFFVAPAGSADAKVSARA